MAKKWVTEEIGLKLIKVLMFPYEKVIIKNI